MKAMSLGSAVARVSYPGCGMIAGKSADGSSAVLTYFIMGRSALSKKRVFMEDGGGVRIEPYIASAMHNEALLVYSPVLAFENKLLIGNGNHVETMYEALTAGKSFEETVAAQGFLPDAPHFTPRLTAAVAMNGEDFRLKMSVVKAMDTVGASTGRHVFSYENIPAGTGYYLHSYEYDANPLPSFTGEPVQVTLNGSIFDIVADIWENLNAENKVALWVRTIDLTSHKGMSRIINKNR